MKITATYDYTDETGTLLYQVVRYEPKDFRQRRVSSDYYRRGRDFWTWNLNGVRRVLYRLPEVVDGIRSGRWIFLCEGEKDADNMAAAGFCATTARGGTGGANKFGELYSDQLEGAYVCILPDNDDPGRKWAKTIAKQLWSTTKGIKIATLLVGLLRLPEKGDATDWIDAYKGDTKLLILQMQDLVRYVDWYVPPPEPVIEKPKQRQYIGMDVTFEAKLVRAHNRPISEIADVKRGLARCPMPGHDDKHPSCTVTDNLWWCPVCDVGGDTIRWFEVQGFPFKEAVGQVLS